MAMNSISVTATGFTAEKKNEMRKLIQYMSGVYNKDFNGSVTHLIASVGNSAKYKVSSLMDSILLLRQLLCQARPSKGALMSNDWWRNSFVFTVGLPRSTLACILVTEMLSILLM